MAVDNGRGKVGLLVDLTGLQHSSVNPDSFVDPCIVEVTWGLLPRPDGKGGTIFGEGGMITGGLQWQGSDTSPKRSSRSCARWMFWSGRAKA
jgi:hypothetical protein